MLFSAYAQLYPRRHIALQGELDLKLLRSFDCAVYVTLH